MLVGTVDPRHVRHARIPSLGSLLLVQVPVLCGGVKYTYNTHLVDYVTSATRKSKFGVVESYQRASRMI